MMESFITKDNSTPLKLFQRLCDIFHQNAFSEISKDSSKLRTYNLIKTKIGMENYLKINIGNKHRIALTKLRLSNHTLMIEKGRHLKLDRNLRYCPFCSNEVEDEIHFMITCKNYTADRYELFDQMSRIHPTFTHIKKEDKFKMLLTNINILDKTAQYIFKSFEKRDITTEIRI